MSPFLLSILALAALALLAVATWRGWVSWRWLAGAVVGVVLFVLARLPARRARELPAPRPTATRDTAERHRVERVAEAQATHDEHVDEVAPVPGESWAERARRVSDRASRS